MRKIFTIPRPVRRHAGCRSWRTAERLKDLAAIAGVRQNQLIGYGIVVGLDGTGDQTTQTPFTVQSIVVDAAAAGRQPAAGHQPAAEERRRRDGHRLAAGLRPAGPDHRHHRVVDRQRQEPARRHAADDAAARAPTARSTRMAQGNVLVGGVGAAAGGAQVQVNHLSVGKISGGATVERAVAVQPGRKQPDPPGTEANRFRHRQPRGRSDQQPFRPRHRHRAGRPRDPRAHAVLVATSGWPSSASWKAWTSTRPRRPPRSS